MSWHLQEKYILEKQFLSIVTGSCWEDTSVTMSTRALRKLQGGRKDLDLPNSYHDKEAEEEEEEEENDKDEQLVKETLLLPSKGPNRFDLVSSFCLMSLLLI